MKTNINCWNIGEKKSLEEIRKHCPFVNELENGSLPTIITDDKELKIELNRSGKKEFAVISFCDNGLCMFRGGGKMRDLHKLYSLRCCIWLKLDDDPNKLTKCHLFKCMLEENIHKDMALENKDEKKGSCGTLKNGNNNDRDK